MRIKSILALAFAALAMTNCSPLNITFFNATSNGVEYKYEVIVPLTNFVRVTAITPADQLTGEVVIPSIVNYDGTNYVVSQIGKSAFEGYSSITEITILRPFPSSKRKPSATARLCAKSTRPSRFQPSAITLSKVARHSRIIVCRLPSQSWAKAVSATAHR